MWAWSTMTAFLKIFLPQVFEYIYDICLYVIEYAWDMLYANHKCSIFISEMHGFLSFGVININQVLQRAF